MTELLEQALDVVRALPADRQDEIATVVLRLAGHDEIGGRLSAGERTAIARSKAAAARGEFATDTQVQAAWAKHGL